MCKSSFDSNKNYENEDFLAFLDVNMTLLLFYFFMCSCSITNFGNSLAYSIEGIDVFFSSQSELSFFGCSETTPLHSYISIESVPCINPAFSALAAMKNSSHILTIVECPPVIIL